MHDFADGSSSFVIKLVQWFGVVDFCCVDLGVTFEYGTPDFLLSFLKVKGEEGFRLSFLDLPNRL
jgi:hypothetical protein